MNVFKGNFKNDEFCVAGKKLLFFVTVSVTLSTQVDVVHRAKITSNFYAIDFLSFEIEI